jgi:hypothetical protein
MADNDGSLISSCESSDGSWTPSIGSGEVSDDEDELVWKETPLQECLESLEVMRLTNRWQAEIYCTNIMRNKVRRFTDDPVLNSIRLDRSLNHGMVLAGTGARCMLCSSGRHGNNASYFVCKTCKVHLCIRARHGHQRSRTDRFHSITNPS